MGWKAWKYWIHVGKGLKRPGLVSPNELLWQETEDHIKVRWNKNSVYRIEVYMGNRDSQKTQKINAFENWQKVQIIWHRVF